MGYYNDTNTGMLNKREENRKKRIDSNRHRKIWMRRFSIALFILIASFGGAYLGIWYFELSWSHMLTFPIPLLAAMLSLWLALLGLHDVYKEGGLGITLRVYDNRTNQTLYESGDYADCKAYIDAEFPDRKGDCEYIFISRVRV